MRLHHTTFRRLMPKYNAYESATGEAGGRARCTPANGPLCVQHGYNGPHIAWQVQMIQCPLHQPIGTHIMINKVMTITFHASVSTL